jgi:ferredoxin
MASLPWVENIRQQHSTRKRQVFLLTGLISLVAILTVILSVLAWHLSAAATVGAIIIGGLSWGLLATAVLAIRERLRSADIPKLLKAQDGLGSIFFLLVLLALALWGFAKAPGVAAPACLGGIAMVAVATLRWAKGALQPRFHIRIANDGSTLILNPGASLLEGLRAQGYDLFAQCGGQGQCATCRVRIVEGPTKWGPAQQGLLTPALLQDHWVLSCQVRVQTDMVIELFKPLVLGWPTLDARPTPSRASSMVAGFPQLSPRARRLRSQLPGFNCGACSYETCDAYAQALANGQTDLDRCLPGGEPVRQRLQVEAQELQLPQVIQRYA